METKSNGIKKWRQITKNKMIESMGGKCQCCGYNKCIAALEFHHIDPDKKDITFGKITANPSAWKNIAEELKKCILVCANCHREIHNDNRQLPSDFVRFNEALITTGTPMKQCKVCGKSTFVSNKTCSKQCAQKIQNTFDWSAINLEEELKYLSLTAIGKKYDMSGSAVMKRCIKLNIDYKSISANRKNEKLAVPKFDRRKVIRPSKEALAKLIWEKPIKHIAAEYNIVDTAVHKWIKQYKLIKPDKGYWQKLKFNKL